MKWSALLLCLTVIVALGGCGNDAAPGSGGTSASKTSGGTSGGPRVITFAPGLTTMTLDMGLGKHIVGVDKYSPTDRLAKELSAEALPGVVPGAGELPGVVGDFLNVQIEPMLAVRPDVILICMQLSHFDTLRQVAPDVEVVRVPLDNLADVAAAMRTIAKACGESAVGERAAKDFEQQLADIAAMTKNLPKKRAMYVLGYTSPLAAGDKSFLQEMIELAGGVNVMKGEFVDWKEPSLERVLLLRPDVVVVQASPENAAEAKAYWEDFFQSHAPGDGQHNLRAVQVEVVTDPRWTQQSGRLAGYTRELAEMLHPELKKQ